MCSLVRVSALDTHTNAHLLYHNYTTPPLEDKIGAIYLETPAEIEAQLPSMVKCTSYFSNQYSPSVLTPLSPVLKSVLPAPRKVPRIVLNFPVPPVRVVTVV